MVSRPAALVPLIVATCCPIDGGLAAVPAGPVRRRGPVPKLVDGEAPTMGVVGEFLGLDQDAAIFTHVRRRYGLWFPTLGTAHRATLARQATNPWGVRARRWRAFAGHVTHDPHVALIDDFPAPACCFARAKRCRPFGGAATFGHDKGARQTLWGLGCRVRLA